VFKPRHPGRAIPAPGEPLFAVTPMKTAQQSAAAVGEFVVRASRLQVPPGRLHHKHVQP